MASSRSYISVYGHEIFQLIYVFGQCLKEGWSEKIAAQTSEGCRVTGRVRVNKVYAVHALRYHTITLNISLVQGWQLPPITGTLVPVKCYARP
jgi:Endoplasmic reticulum vesicle transporter